MKTTNNSDLKILVVENNKQVNATISTYLAELGFIDIKFVQKTGVAKQIAQFWRPDLVLIDIDAKNEVESVGLGSFLTYNLEIPFVFITNDLEHSTAEEIIETKPSGCVLKPMNKIQFFVAINAAVRCSLNHAKLHNYTNEDEIIYMQAFGNYWEVVTPGGRQVVRKSLNELIYAKRIDQFVRIHRSYVVNSSAVLKVLNGKAILANGSSLPVSRTYLQEVRNSC